MTKKHMRIEMAAQDKITQHDAEVTRALQAVALVMNEPGIAQALVTDESKFGDFLSGTPEVKEQCMKEVSLLLGFHVIRGDYIYKVAERMAQGKD